jgi:hypothetical protein
LDCGFLGRSEHVWVLKHTIITESPCRVQEEI